MQYGQIDASYFERNGYQWPANPVVSGSKGPSLEALAIAMAMPSVTHTGHRTQRNGLKAAGLGTYAHAATMMWAAGDVNHGLIWRDAFDAWRNSTDKRPGNDSTKTNHLNGLKLDVATGGLITVTVRNGKLYTALTDAGVAQCKSVNPELGKVARAFHVKALNKAFDAAAKAANPPKAKKAKAKPEPVETPVDDMVPPVDAGVTSEPVDTGVTL